MKSPFDGDLTAWKER